MRLPSKSDLMSVGRSPLQAHMQSANRQTHPAVVNHVEESALVLSVWFDKIEAAGLLPRQACSCWAHASTQGVSIVLARGVDACARAQFARAGGGNK
eukprot:6856861-Alexandrium_andersonii.AAC.1